MIIATDLGSVNQSQNRNSLSKFNTDGSRDKNYHQSPNGIGMAKKKKSQFTKYSRTVEILELNRLIICRMLKLAMHWLAGRLAHSSTQIRISRLSTIYLQL